VEACDLIVDRGAGRADAETLLAFAATNNTHIACKLLEKGHRIHEIPLGTSFEVLKTIFATETAT
jgi:hypothetical protein